MKMTVDEQLNSLANTIIMYSPINPEYSDKNLTDAMTIFSLILFSKMTDYQDKICLNSEQKKEMNLLCAEEIKALINKYTGFKVG